MLDKQKALNICYYDISLLQALKTMQKGSTISDCQENTSSDIRYTSDILYMCGKYIRYIIHVWKKLKHISEKGNQSIVKLPGTLIFFPPRGVETVLFNLFPYNYNIQVWVNITNISQSPPLHPIYLHERAFVSAKENKTHAV